jgi:hypothetical protein
VLFAALLLILCACEPEPTPLPSILPTAQPTEEADPNAMSAPLRYGIADVLLAYMSDEERSLIAAAAEIIPLADIPAQQELGERYGLIVVPGWQSDGTFTPAPLQISLLLDMSLAPLDDPALADVVRNAVHMPAAYRLLSPTPMLNTPEAPLGTPTTAPEVLRGALANAGYPDGFDLTLSTWFTPDSTLNIGVVPFLTTGLEQLYGIEVRLVPAGEPAHLTLTTLPTPNAIVLYTIPVSYRAVDGLNITFTPSGFPIASR